MDFDPEQLSFAALLAYHFETHGAFRKSFSRQYRSAILYANEEQRRVAEGVLAQLAAAAERCVETALEPLESFTLAEDDHQKYVLRRHTDVVDELTALYPRREEFLRSAAVTRANAFLGGNAEPQLFERDVVRMGLSERALRTLRQAVS